MNLRRWLTGLVGLIGLAAVGLVAAFLVARWLTRAEVVVPDHEPSAERGAYIFTAAGCVACHTAKGDDARPLAGGRALGTPFGVFFGPNITPDPRYGIGAWSDADFIRALGQGVAPDGSDYFPVFPYASFTRMTPEDMMDLRAYLLTVAPVAQPNRPHEAAFPFNIRAGVAFWKVLNFTPGALADDLARDEIWNRGRYLVRALAHCGECHTPRDVAGAPIAAMALAGTEDGPEGKAVPNITPDAATGIGAWSAGDVTYFLQAGMNPDGDFAGGAMAEVIRETTSKLTDDDRAAIAAYLLSRPAIANRIAVPRTASRGGGEAWE